MLWHPVYQLLLLLHDANFNSYVFSYWFCLVHFIAEYCLYLFSKKHVVYNFCFIFFVAFKFAKPLRD